MSYKDWWRSLWSNNYFYICVWS